MFYLAPALVCAETQANSFPMALGTGSLGSGGLWGYSDTVPLGQRTFLRLQGEMLNVRMRLMLSQGTGMLAWSIQWLHPGLSENVT